MTDLIADPDKFVTVGKFLEPANAQMAKGVLESAGIECFLQGENANSLLALAFRARLLVHKQDEEAARELLGSAGDELTEEEQRELEAGDDEGGPAQLTIRRSNTARRSGFSKGQHPHKLVCGRFRPSSHAFSADTSSPDGD